MGGVLTGSLFRVASAYTAALWLAGFVWAKIDLAASGRFYGWIGLAGDLPGIAVTAIFAIALQTAIIAAHRARVAGRVGGRFGVTAPMLPVAMLLVAASLASGGADTVAHSIVAERWVPAMRGWAAGTRGEWLRVSFVYSWMYSLNIALVVLAITTEEARRQAAMLAQAREAAQIAHLTMLRYQLNPHFLFNSLNAVSSLVLTGQTQAAERMIDRLAAFLRDTNASDPGGFVTLADELSTIDTYLEVEAVRFGDRMRVAFDIGDGCGDVLVPSFLLQPLVENAIKYAVAPRQGDGEIRIAAHEAGGRLDLVVEDDGKLDGLPGGGTGIGLPNVRARLRAFYGDAATCGAGRGERGFVVAITMPAWRQDRRDQDAVREAGCQVVTDRLPATATSRPAMPSLR